MSDPVKVKVARKSRGDKLQLDREGKGDSEVTVRVARMDRDGK